VFDMVYRSSLYRLTVPLAVLAHIAVTP